MNVVTLHRDGSMEAGGRSVDVDPLACLGLRIELGSGYSLRSLFRMLSNSPEMVRLSVFLGDLLEQYRNSPSEGCVWPEFEALEFAKTVEMVGFPGKPRLEIYNAFHGVRDAKTGDIRALRLESLLDMPVRLGRLRHVVFGDKVDVFEFETVYSLFEFIDGIAWELSFHGSPRECQLRR